MEQAPRPGVNGDQVIGSTEYPGYPNRKKYDGDYTENQQVQVQFQKPHGFCDLVGRCHCSSITTRPLPA